MFLLDTNICIFIMNSRPLRVRERMEAATRAGHRLAVSSITLHELQFGVYNSAKPQENGERLRAFAAGLSVLPFEENAAKQAAIHRTALKKIGQLIGPYDLLIAGHALALEAVLVTNNVGEFGRIEELKVEDWAE
ncbi:type II toxin-antitoxin system VapC family toxin [Deinococcus detaillensis]|uniref:Ribonuclease VapC n=1 Tax=Deinococcus detaillensis TaxID=2592048 RepID=A0A553V6Q1_9DEIO|nr:type II toxin-antitoxin system VapC family toxin [Deinococcus detaillensis]